MGRKMYDDHRTKDGRMRQKSKRTRFYFRSMIRLWAVAGAGLILPAMGVSVCDAASAEKPINIKISTSTGYDNNTGLNAQRYGDKFAQETMSIYHKRLLNQKAQMRLSYNALNVNYFEATDQNVFLNDFSGGVNYLLNNTTMWENNYTFQFLELPYNSSVSSFNNEFRSGIKQKLGSRYLLRYGLAISQRDYRERKMRTGDGLPADDGRVDGRVVLDASLAYKWLPAVTLNSGTVIYQNASNDAFNDYYDYMAYKCFAGYSWQINPKLVSSGQLTYERRHYNSRSLVDVDDLAQSDHIYTLNLGLYYKLTNQLTMGSTYTYREKNSNEPSQQYSGSIGTLGLYLTY